MLLFLGKTILLTPVSISIDAKCVDIALKENLRVLNSGAALEVELPKPTPNAWLDDIDREYPAGTVTGSLTRKDGSRLVVASTSSSIAKSAAYLIITPPGGVYRDGEEYSGLKLCSGKPIAAAKILWRNASK